MSHRSVSVSYASSWVHDDIVNFIESICQNVCSGSWDKTTREFLWRGLCFHLLYRLLAPFGLATCQDHLAEVKRGMRGMRGGAVCSWSSKAALLEKCKHTQRAKTCKPMKKGYPSMIGRNTNLLLAAPREVQGHASSNAQRLQCQSGRNLPMTKQLSKLKKKTERTVKRKAAWRLLKGARPLSAG